MIVKKDLTQLVLGELKEYKDSMLLAVVWLQCYNRIDSNFTFCKINQKKVN